MRTDVRHDLVSATATTDGLEPGELEALLDDLDLGDLGLDGLIAEMTVECAGACGATFVPRSRVQRTCGSARCKKRVSRAARRATS